ncbi:MAG: hypothetical protein KGS48_00745 [Bacteroidetes bacterium]|nr:hypothetical protein [Bacteroidota bacterium]
MTLLTRFSGILILACLGLAQPVFARPKYFEFSNPAFDLYQKIVSLRLNEARAGLDAYKKSEPDNLIPLFLENYYDFMLVFINDDEAEYQRLQKNMEPRLAKIARGDSYSPYYLYTQAEIRLQWSLLHLRYSAYLSAMSDVKQAFALLEENQRKFPDFIANKKSLGIMHAMVGNIPDDYKWAVRALGGMHGTVTQGIAELEEVLAFARKTPFLFEAETQLAYAIIQYYYNNNYELAWKTLKNSKLATLENPLAQFALGTVAMRTGQNDEAIRILSKLPGDPAFHPFYLPYYMLGLAKLRRLDLDANQYLEYFLNHYHGKNNLKEANQKLAWYHLVQDNELGYQTYMHYVKIKGGDNNEADKSALLAANSGEIPDQRLLKARLLFDGGYFQRAYDLLKNAAGDYANNHKFHLEYLYRMGRITQNLNKRAEAIQFYQQAVQLGSSDPWYYACNAALQMGIIHEKQGSFAEARKAFQTCLNLKTEEYGASLHAQAKAGLSRVKGR